MSIPVTRRPQYRLAHPGEHLREDYMPDCGFTVSSLATALGVSRQSINELINERRGVSADMALRLGRLFSQSPESWLDLQRDVDLWDAREAIKDDLARIKPLPLPPILTEEEDRIGKVTRVSENTPRRKSAKRRTKAKR